MNKGTIIKIKRMLLISMGILILTGATIHMQGACKVDGYGGARVENAGSLGNGGFR